MVEKENISARDNLIHVGIDPGNKYACAIIRAMSNQKMNIRVYSDIESTLNALRDVLNTIKDTTLINAWIEQVGAMSYVSIDKQTGKQTVKSQRGKSNFGFGFDTGWFYGFFAAHNIKLNSVLPKIWLHEFNTPSRLKPSDIPYFPIAQRLFPQLKQQLKYKTKHHDNAAALLICEYGRRKVLGMLQGRKVRRIETIYEFTQ